MIRRIVAAFLLSILLSACGDGQPTTAPPPEAAPAETAAEETPETGSEVVTDTAATSPPADPTDRPPPIEATAPPVSESDRQNSDDTAEAPADADQASVTIEPIEVTYFTPIQQEGPYYTVNKPDDRDNDLTVLAGVVGLPSGQVLEFGGKVYNADGLPLEGLTVEIWQTDGNGVYLHPNDPTTAERDQNFQFYGESVTGADGGYNFRTILPGQYEPRPRHIHLKVKNGQEELLTSQIYFRGDESLEADDIFLDGGNENEYLVMTMEAGQDASGTPILKGEHNLILNTTLSTASAAEETP